jgi:hypothetical protein
MHENREASEMPVALQGDRPAGEDKSRTPRMHVSEESDSGTVPMNHSNKSGKPPAESEEGRPLIKENTHQSSTHSTQSEVRCVPGVSGCAQGSKGTEGDAVRCFASPPDSRTAPGKLLRPEAKGRPRCGRRHVAGV